MKHLAFCLLAACGAPHTTATTKAVTTWELPAGWRTEVIPFPLDFAPALAHRGVEELRFAPGMFDPAAPGYWSYAFVWRLDEPAVLDEVALSAELTAYFRGLIAAVDGDHRITEPDKIAVTVAPGGALTAHIFDAFKTALPVDLVGTAERRSCGTGSLWVFAMAPAASGVRPELKRLAAAAACDQQPVAKPVIPPAK